MRLFLGIGLDRSLRESLGGAVEELRAARAPIRWVKPENLHLTLKFLGDTEEGKAASLASALKEAVREIWAFELTVQGAGVFPGRSRPRVVWVDVQEPSGTLAKLWGLVEEVTGSMGWKRERRGFSPHITLGRVKGNINLRQLADRVDALEGRHWGSQESRQLTLFRSHLSPGGVRYEVVRNFPFKR